MDLNTAPQVTEQPSQLDEVSDAIDFLNSGPTREPLTHLLRRVSNRLGIRIEVNRNEAGLFGNLTGFLYTSSGCARIFVRQSDPLTYQSRCILHEIGHLLCGHSGCAGIGTSDTKSAFSVIDSRLTLSSLPISSDSTPNAASQALEEQAELVARAAERRLLMPRYARDEASWGGL
jgi:hypothetical protein